METLEIWFDKIYKANYERLVRITERIFTYEEAEEVVQEAFLILLHHANELLTHENPAGFLYYTVRNLIGDELRRRNRIQFISIEEVKAAVREDIYFDSLESELPDGLSQEDKEILLMRVEQHNSYEEISKRLGIPPGACRARAFRARKRCKELYLKDIGNWMERNILYD